MQIFPRSTIAGTAFEIGEQLGRLCRPVLGKYLSDPVYVEQLNAWKKAYPLNEMMALSAHHFPDCWEELRGISAGCNIELDDVYLWNCRPDLARNAYDSSTTAAVNRLANRFIVQEILEPPALLPHCRIVEVKPARQPAFLALYTPGMLPGMSFSTNRAGLVQSINLLDTPAFSGGVPSALIARAALQCCSLLEALETLTSTPRMGGAHHVLAWAGEFIMLSIEATVNKVSVMPISNKYAHTNHTVHPEQESQDREVNASSLARYSTLIDELKSIPDHPSEDDILAWVKNGQGRVLGSDVTTSRTGESGAGITVLFRCISKKISVQLFNADRSGMQTFSFSVDKSMAGT